MPRQPRTSSGTGIYHVMHRGINRQDIFEEQEDYQQFLIRLHNLVDPKDKEVLGYYGECCTHTNQCGYYHILSRGYCPT